MFHKYLCFSLAAACSLAPSALASAVDSAFGYQNYLDFGANRGQFTPGSAVAIAPLAPGGAAITVAPMPDFRAANGHVGETSLIRGETTYIGANYLITAAHMISSKLDHGALITQGAKVEFGGVEVPIIDTSRSFANYNDGSDKINSFYSDFAVLKTAKLPLTTPAALMGKNYYSEQFDLVPQQKAAFINDATYSMFARAGTGVQMISQGEGAVYVQNARKYFTGALTGAQLAPIPDHHGITFTDYSDGVRKGFSSVLGQGDSGSALYGYNPKTARWEVVAVASETSCKGDSNNQTPANCNWSNYHLIDLGEIEKFTQIHEIAISHDVTSDGNELRSNGAALKTRVHKSTGAVRLGEMSLDEDIQEHFSDVDTYVAAKQASDSFDKNLKISGGSSFTLSANTDLGASALIIAPNMNYRVAGQYEFIHAGLDIGANSTVDYEAITPAGDALHKIGAGTLKIAANSQNAGSLHLGGGRTELASGARFAKIYLANDAVLVANSMPADYEWNNGDINHIKIHSGTLDMAGNSLHVGEFRANEGAKIISSQPAQLEFNNSNSVFMHANISGDIALKNALSDNEFIYDNGFKITSLTAKPTMNATNPTLVLQGRPVLHNYVDATTAAKILQLGGGEVFSAPSAPSQSDWQDRSYEAQNASISNATLEISRNASLQIDGTLTLENAKLLMAKGTAYTDKEDGVNLLNVSAYAAPNAAHAARLASGASAMPNVRAKAAFIRLNNSQIEASASWLSGDITADSTSLLRLNNVNFSGSINASALEANGSYFTLSQPEAIKITQTATGSGNYLSIQAPLAPQSGSDILLAELPKSTPQAYFQAAAARSGLFSSLAPNIKFASDERSARWYLAALENQPSQPAPNDPATPAIPGQPAPSDPAAPSQPAKPSQPNEPAPAVPGLEGFDTNPANNASNQETPGFYEKYFFVKEHKKAIEQAHSALSQLFFAQILEWNNLHKRMGDLRASSGAAGVWAKTMAGESKHKSASTSDFFELQAGVDKRSEFASGANFTGVMLAASKAKPGGDNFDGKGISGFGAGLYSSWLFDNGYYFDLVGKFMQMKNRFWLQFANGAGDLIRLDAPNHARNFYASAEFGRRIMLANGYFIEPSAEIITGRVGGQSFNNDAAAVWLKSEAFSPLSAKIALAFGRSASAQTPLGFRAQAAWAQDLARSGGVIIRDLNVMRRFAGTRDSRLLLSAGLSYAARGWVLSADIERSDFGDFRIPLAINFTLRKDF